VRLHEFGPEVIAPLIGAVASLVGAIAPLLVAWVQKPSREIIIIHAGNEIGRGNLRPDEIRQTLEQLAGQGSGTSSGSKTT
jgi:hypothetical protein